MAAKSKAAPPPVPESPPAGGRFELDEDLRVSRAESAEIAQALITGMQQKHGKEGSYAMTDPNRLSAIRTWLPMGVHTIEERIGRLGLPVGRIIEIYGKPGSGKTTLGTHFLSAAQSAGALGILVDTENAYDNDYAQAQGVDLTRLIGIPADTIEDIFSKSMDAIIGLRAGELVLGQKKIKLKKPFEGPIFVLVDSIGQTATIAELEKLAKMNEKGEAVNLPMSAAKVIRGQMRAYAPLVSRHQAVVVFCNHTYTGQKPPGANPTAPAPEISYGGDGIKFAASLRFHTRILQTLYKDGADIGERIKVKIEKNKISPFSGEVELEILRGRGIREIGMYIDDLIRSGRLCPSGSWFPILWEGQLDKIQGKEAYITWLEDHPGALEDYLAAEAAGTLT